MIDHVNLILPFFYSREDQEEIYDNFKALKTPSDKKSWAAKYCSIYGTGTYEQMMYHLPKRKPLTDIFREDPLEEQSNMVRVCKEFFLGTLGYELNYLSQGPNSRDAGTVTNLN